MEDTVHTAYLFQCRGEDLYAVSHDKSGTNIPRSPCTEGWHFCEAFRLGRGIPVPAPILAEPILRGISDHGYYVWRGWSGPTKRPTRYIGSGPEDAEPSSRCDVTVQAKRIISI
jgi:hypothetical protein